MFVGPSAERPPTPGRRSNETSKLTFVPTPVPTDHQQRSPLPKSCEQPGSADGWLTENHELGAAKAARSIPACTSRLLRLPGVLWMVPAAAVLFALCVGAMGNTTGHEVLPGVQALLVMSLLQFCWAIMTHQTGQRRLVRFAQLACAFLAVLTLLPRRQTYGSRILVAAFDDDGGVILPAFATSLAKLFGFMDPSPQPKPGEAGYEDEVEVDRTRFCLEVSLAVVLMLWLLQAATATHASQAPRGMSAAAYGGPAAPGPALVSSLKSHNNLTVLGVFVPTSETQLRLEPRSPPDVEPGCGGGSRAACAPPSSGKSCQGQLERFDYEVWRCGSRAAAPAASCLGRGVLLCAVCGAQCAAAVAIVATWRLLRERTVLDEIGSSDRQPRSLVPDVGDSMSASWATLALLAVAMSAPLALPGLLNSRLLLHNALLRRPATSRNLGLLLLDVNASKLLLAVSVGALGGWRAGVLTWQLLQVLTVLVGVARLYLDGLRTQAQLLSAAAPVAGLSGADAQARLTLCSPVGTGCEDGQPGPYSSSDCASARATSPRFTDALARATCGVADRGCSYRAVPDVSPATLVPASCGDGGCATTASTAMICSCGSGSNMTCTPYSSGCSLVSAADAEQHQLQPAASCCGAGSPTAASAALPQLARRPPSLVNGVHALHCPHAQQSPLFQSTSACASGSSSKPLTTSRRATSLGCGRGCGRVFAAFQSWGLLLGSLGSLACVLWLVLIAPPLAALGDEPEEFLEGLMSTGPGASVVMALLAGMSAALVMSVTCLVWCTVKGLLRRLQRVEARRMECLAWACGSPLVVAGLSALSWALGDEHNAAAYTAAEMMRFLCLWPLVWLQEPWLLGGMDCTAGCVQHAGCGVTCCVLRWFRLRPSSAGMPGTRCDERASEPAAALSRSSSRRTRWPLQVEIN